MGIALPLINIFGEQPVRMLFSRSWTLREKAIQIIESEIIRGIINYISDNLESNSKKVLTYIKNSS